MRSEPLKVGIIGFGTIAKRHFAEIKKLRPATQIIIRTRQDIQKINLPETTQLTASINEVVGLRPDVIIVASPSSEHAYQIHNLAQNTDLLIIEKPIAADVSDATKINRVASNTQCDIRIAYNLRYLEGLPRLRDVLSSSILGDIHNFDITVGQDLELWRPHRNLRESVSAQASKGGGVMRELSHELDLAIHLFGKPKHSTLRRAKLKYVELDVEDTAIIQAQFGINSILGTINLDFTRDTPMRIISIRGECGKLVWDLLAGEITIEVNGKKEILFSKDDDLPSTYAQMWSQILLQQDTILPKAEEATEIIYWIEDMEKRFKMEKSK